MNLAYSQYLKAGNKSIYVEGDFNIGFYNNGSLKKFKMFHDAYIKTKAVQNL